MKKNIFRNVGAILLGMTLAFTPMLFGCSDGTDDPVKAEKPGDQNPESGDKDKPNDQNPESGDKDKPDDQNPPSAVAGEIKIGETKYNTIQEALDACTGTGEYTIVLGKGTYNEIIHYNGAATIKISGDTTAARGSDVVIEAVNWGDMWYFEKDNREIYKTTYGSEMKGRCVFEFEGSGNLILENLTIKNSFSRKTNINDYDYTKRTDGKTSAGTQAEALGTDTTGFVAAYNCTFLSHQDTVRTSSKAWFYNCYVEGDVDFLWMSNKSIVSLYEKCEINAIGDESSTAYITAPCFDVADKVGKGLVILNSTLRANCEKTYLYRNPWGSDTTTIYNSVAIINAAKGESNNSFDIKLSTENSGPCVASGISQSKIGWKIDNASSTVLGVSPEADTIVSDDDLAKEFSGRKAILNRMFDVKKKVYEKDADKNWDIAALISKNGWSVDADDSSDLLEGEKAPAEGLAAGKHNIRNLMHDATTVNSAIGANANGENYEDGSAENGCISWTSFQQQNVWAKFGDNGVLNVKVKGNCEIEWETSGTASNFTVEDSNGKKWVDNGSGTDTFKFFYNGEETTLKFTAAKNVYIRYFTIAYSDTAYANGVGSVAISGGNSNLVKNSTMQLSATTTDKYVNNVAGCTAGDATVSWAVKTGDDAAEIDNTGKVTAKDVSADTNVTVTATAGGVSKDFSFKVTAVASTKETVLWDWQSEKNVTYYTAYTDATTNTPAVQLQSNTGYIKGSSSNILAYADTTGTYTENGSTGPAKVATSGTMAQVNGATKIQVPVSAGSILTVVSYPNYYQFYTIGGLKATANTCTYTASASGYVEIEVSNVAQKSYLYAIKVTDVDYTEAHTVPITISAFTSTDTATASPTM